MRGAAFIGAALACTALPAAALTPPWMVCDNADGSTSEYMLNQSASGAERILSFQVFAKGDTTGQPEAEVLLHCASGKALSWDPETMTDRAYDKMIELREGKRRVTLKQMHRALRAAGLKTAYGRINAGNCACDEESYYPSF